MYISTILTSLREFHKICRCALSRDNASSLIFYIIIRYRLKNSGGKNLTSEDFLKKTLGISDQTLLCKLADAAEEKRLNRGDFVLREGEEQKKNSLKTNRH